MENTEFQKINQKGLFPIPGQSLTNDPENPAPFEGPPEFTTVHETSLYIFNNLLETKTHLGILDLLRDGFPLVEMVETILFKAFQEGKIDPNLMMLMAEPVAFMLLALAERVDIDPVFFRDDVEDDQEEEEMFGVALDQEKINSFKKAVESKVPEGAVPKEIMDKIEALPKESLLAPTETKSLLDK